MVKSNLIGIVKNTVRSVALVGAMALTLYGCKDYVPVASLDVSPLSGVVPV
jgi:hypothetical protein